MKNLDQYQASISVLREEINLLNQQIGAKETEIGQTRRTYDKTKAEVSALTGRVATINRDMRFKGLSHDESVKLRQDLSEKENELKSLSQSLRDLQTSAEWLRGQASSKNQQIAVLRRQHSASMIDDAVGKAALAAEEPLRDLICCMLAGKNPNEKPDDIYQKIGLELCKKVLGERNAFQANLPDIFEARRKVDNILSNAA